MGRDVRGYRLRLYHPGFQSTRPRGARRRQKDNRASDANFNPRARVGRDPCSVTVRHFPDVFQSTRPRGARPPLCPSGAVSARFQSTRPRGARQIVYRLLSILPYFNPRARVGRDFVRLYSSFNQLEFQSTRPRGARQLDFSVKQHLQQFQSTRPRGARLDRLPISLYASIFQSTRPRGARPSKSMARFLIPRFQSTRPRGARRSSSSTSRPSSHFNPRARVGRDRRSSPFS